LFERLPHVTVVGEARNGQEALRLLWENHPDIAFVDISMPGFDGLTFIRRASSIAPHVHLIVLSMYSLESYVSEALEAGASGYLLKQTADLTELNLETHRSELMERWVDPCTAGAVHRRSPMARRT